MCAKTYDSVEIYEEVLEILNSTYPPANNKWKLDLIQEADEWRSDDGLNIIALEFLVMVIAYDNSHFKIEISWNEEIYEQWNIKVIFSNDIEGKKPFIGEDDGSNSICILTSKEIPDWEAVVSGMGEVLLKRSINELNILHKKAQREYEMFHLFKENKVAK